MGTTNTLDLNNRVDKLEKVVSGGDSAQANKADIATEFNTTTNYTAGCFVYYGGKLYQFNTDHAAGTWDPTDVVESNVTDQIVSNKSAIESLTALDVAYDNTASGLLATDVQGAVDEVAEKIIQRTYNTTSSSTSEYGVYDWHANITVEGYIPVMYCFQYSNSASVIIGCESFSNTGMGGYCNFANFNITLRVLYMKV